MSPHKQSESETEIFEKAKRKSRNRLYALLGGLASVAVVAPFAWSAITWAVDMSKLPGRVYGAETRGYSLQEQFVAYTNSTDAKLNEMLDNEHLIMRALHVDRPPKQKDQPN